MKALEALKITTDTVKLDAVLTGEAPNLNRLTFWLSELSYGRKWVGTTWSHCVPRDIIRTAAEITQHAFTAPELLTVISNMEGK